MRGGCRRSRGHRQAAQRRSHSLCCGVGAVLSMPKCLSDCRVAQAGFCAIDATHTNSSMMVYRPTGDSIYLCGVVRKYSVACFWCAYKWTAPSVPRLPNRNGALKLPGASWPDVNKSPNEENTQIAPSGLPRSHVWMVCTCVVTLSKGTVFHIVLHNIRMCP